MRLYLDHDLLALDFPYDPAQVAEVKAIAGATWDKVDKLWKAPVASINEVRAFAMKHEFQITDEVLRFTAPKRASRKGVYVKGDWTYIQFPYDKVVLKAVKQIPGITWDNKEMAWRAPLTSSSEAIAWANSFDVLVSPEVHGVSASIGKKLDELKEASRSTDADIEVPLLQGTLLPYQRAGVEYASKARRSFIADEMGLGKTIQAIATLEYSSKDSEVYPAVVVCPPSLVLNWKSEWNRWLPHRRVAVVTNRRELPEPRTYDVLVVGYSNISHWEKHLLAHNSYIFDESHYCFTGDTTVSTLGGEMTIKEIFETDKDVYVASCASWGSAIVYNRVVNKFRLSSQELVKVVHQYGEFICTHDHQILTEFGYKEASSLTQDCYLRVLPERIPSEMCDQQVLLKVVQEQGNTDLAKDGGSNYWLNKTRCENKNDREQPNVFSGNKSQSIQDTERNGSPTKNKGRERPRLNEATVGTMEGAWGWVGNRVSSVLWKTETSRASNSLQDRYRKPVKENSHRGRWIFPSGIVGSGKRQKENSVSCFSRVVSVEVYEQGDRGQLGDGHYVYPVYDIEVEKTHTFFANGVLVSNCKSPTAQRTKSAIKMAKSAPKHGIVLCLTGTPVTNRPAEYASQLDIIGKLKEFGGLWGFYRRYCSAFQDRFGQWNINGHSHLDELNDRLRGTCYIRRTKSQVLSELPPVIHSPLVVEGTEAGLKEYRKAEQDIIKYITDRAKEIAIELGESPYSAAVVARIKAESNEHLVKLSVLRRLAAKAKMPMVEEWVQSRIDDGKKVVIAAHHRDVVDELARRFGNLRIQGGMDVADVEAQKARFQDEPVETAPVIVLSIQAAKTGHTLTASQDILFVELPYTPADLDQTYSRLHRIGQKGSVTTTYMLVEGTIDEEIYALIERKRKVVNAATEGGEFASGGNATQLILDLLNRHK